MLFKDSCLQPPSTPPTPAIPTLLFYFSNVDIQSTQMAFYVCSEIKDFSKMDIKIEPDVCWKYHFCPKCPEGLPAS